MHPVSNVRGTLSHHLEGKRIVLGICGSIAAVKTVELARELARHGAHVHAVMTDAATRIVTPDALEFATGNPVITRLSGQVEHVALLGDVPEKADLLLVAPATANTVGKMALGLDDSTVTTCATVAFGTGTPVVVAPAMHDAMLDHPIVARHARTLIEDLDVSWVEPKHEEKKAKLADVEAIVEAVIHRLATRPDRRTSPGPLAGQRCLVVNGSTEEDVDAVRVLTNRSSGRSGHLIATELHRLGATVTLWEGRASEPAPSWVEARAYRTHADLMAMAEAAEGFDAVWMPAAIGDYAPAPVEGKKKSGHAWRMDLKPLGKVIEVLRGRLPDALLVAFKAEATADGLEERARERMTRYDADYVVANTAAAFGAHETRALLISPDAATPFEGPKAEVLASIVLVVAQQGARVRA